MHSIAQFCSRGARTTIALWAGVSLLLNLVWEVAQLPLYTLPSAQSAAQIIYAVAHCLAGDVMIAATIFAGTAWLIGDLDWPISRPWRGGAAVTLFGVAYTACSEWYNVYQIGSWGYTSSMPLIYGIGLAPLLQWVFIPVCTLLIVRARWHVK